MRKLTALLLALLMLAMPLSALAEETAAPLHTEDYYTKALEAGRRIHYEFSFGELPEELTSDPEEGYIVSVLFDALAVEMHEQGNEGSFAIGFKKADGSFGSVLDLAVLADGSDAYIKSNLLGAGTVVIGEDDILVVLGRLMGVLVEMGAMDADEAMSMVAELPAMIEMIKSQMVAINPEDLMNLDYTALYESVPPILAKAEQVEMTMQPKNCDAAVSEYKLVLTEEDGYKLAIGLLKFVKANPVLLKLLESQSSAQYNYLYEEAELPTMEEQLDQMIAELETIEPTEESSDLHVFYWLDEKDEIVCLNAYEIDAVGTIPDTAMLSYNRLTMNDKVAYTANINDGYAETMTLEAVVGAESLRVSLAMDEFGEPYMSMLMDVACVEEGNNIKTDMFIEIADYSYADFEEYPYDSEEVVRIDVKEDTTLNGVDFVSNAEVAVSVNGQKMITLYCDSYTEDPVASIKDGEVIRLAALTDAEFANWFSGVMNSIQSWPMTLIMNMPAELLQMMMQEGM